MNMDIVKTPELLIAIADESYGLKLKPIEAEIMLGYLEGSDSTDLTTGSTAKSCASTTTRALTRAPARMSTRFGRSLSSAAMRTRSSCLSRKTSETRRRSTSVI